MIASEILKSSSKSMIRIYALVPVFRSIALRDLFKGDFHKVPSSLILREAKRVLLIMLPLSVIIEI